MQEKVAITQVDLKEPMAKGIVRKEVHVEYKTPAYITNRCKGISVVKKDGTIEAFNISKVVRAVTLSSDRVMIKFTPSEVARIEDEVSSKAQQLSMSRGNNKIEIADMHRIVESVLEELHPEVARSYREYRNYKIDFVEMLNDVYKEAQKIMFIGDRENSNTDSALVSTKRCLTFNVLNKELYKKFFLTTEELQAAKDGYIYIHDMSARRDTMNCCLCNVTDILHNGFEMGNIWYNEPKTLDVAFDVIGDIVLSAASQQYGLETAVIKAA